MVEQILEEMAELRRQLDYSSLERPKVAMNSDRAPRLPEVATHIREEVDALHKMLSELEGRLSMVLTPAEDDKLALDGSRPSMSEFGSDLMRSRDGVHVASNRIRDLLNRLDL